MQLDTITALRMKAQLARFAEVMMAHPDQLPLGVQTLGARSKHEWPYTCPPGGPPGQSRAENLGPLGRGEHRFKTFGRVRVRQPAAGTFVWRTRFGRVIVTNPAGTHDLGTGTFADAVWHSVAGGDGRPRAA